MAIVNCAKMTKCTKYWTMPIIMIFLAIPFWTYRWTHPWQPSTSRHWQILPAGFRSFCLFTMYKGRWSWYQFSGSRHLHYLRQWLEPSEWSPGPSSLSPYWSGKRSQNLSTNYQKYLRKRNVWSCRSQAWTWQGRSSIHEHWPR